ncbi:MAG TPA: SCP2 sterol-binding domain-containing protein [Acidimicrobiales bacterium]
MPHPFLSSTWFDEMDKLRAEAPEPTGATADLTVNIVVTGAPEGDAEVHIKGGQFDRGLLEGAPTKLTVPYAVAKSIFIDGNQQAGMQAFMSGQIKVEGDMTKLMAMQAGGTPSAEQQAFQQKLKDLTE